MGRANVSAVYGLVTLAVSSCTTEACDCPPSIVPAVVTGRVLDHTGGAAAEALVWAYSAPATDCHSLDIDLGLAVAENDGGFRLEVATGQLQDSVCVLVFAQPRPGSEGLENSDTNLLVMDFRDEPTPDSARIELVLKGQ
jgi:hypothetical protein